MLNERYATRNFALHMVVVGRRKSRKKKHKLAVRNKASNISVTT
jgi:hypothetical protein